MSCAQVMYQPYAPSPYVVVPADATTPLAAAPPHVSGPATPGGGDGVLHLPSSATTTPHTPPHAHHLQPLPQARQSGEGAVGPVQGAADPSGGQCGQPRPQYRAPSNGSATADPDAPPPEKKFCSETEVSSAPPPPPPPSQHQHTSPHLHHHHQQHHHHHHHHHHHPHHHPPLTEPPGSPSQHANEVKYVSANCMVVTHYAGDTAAVVDEHFSRALSTPLFEKPHSPGKGKLPPIHLAKFSRLDDRLLSGFSVNVRVTSSP
nr:zinc-finger homeodomain protein 7-like [Procambarus clarkii]